ncbi:MAG TPA: lysophospholipid acyltransferase family protein [Azoarcus taiwanensis]|uniref:1-acyl-sn-glycerol-3-phosphate acyltransferase n=1 Tax=Azoarcus taiwanensis TaxID=666964 RepID=A0A972FA93_9RHOO|nr:lysophospholipid acyltransferase family protein [Azoarcus taiwanensis]NMG04775.1 1-acyl-sn-glycerol-3-phosphate acyltransferase [Azoarcus taiwanensis]HRQ56276.1 lysophospholipid acyltransferase family protein [Azoarcus taiwanensis]
MRLALHLLIGLCVTLFVYPLRSPLQRQRIRQRWSSRLLAIVGLRLEHEGERVQPGCLLVANHVSWLDIFVVNALAPAAFVSKAEVRNWPLIGVLAARNETVFLMRGSRGHARIINAEVGAILDAGRNVALFPEGTTTDGSHVLHFHAALLQPAVESGHSVQPVAISYLDAQGRHSLAPAYAGDTSLIECLMAIVGSRALIASVSVGSPLPTCNGLHRKEVARQARETIVAHVSRHAGQVERHH